MKNYFKICLFGGVIYLAGRALSLTSFEQYLHPFVSYMVAFYVVQSLLIAWVESILVKGSHQNFVFFVIGSISFRLVTSLIAAMFFLLAVGSQNTLFIINFFALYLLFLGFELFMLMTNLRSNFENSSN